MEARRLRAQHFHLPLLTSPNEATDCIIVSHVDIYNKPHRHTVVLGYRARNTSRALKPYKSSIGVECMIFNNAILNHNITEAVGCSCIDFKYRGLPSKFLKHAGDAAFGCKHIFYVNMCYFNHPTPPGTH